jgi:hypothetical protein
MNNSEIKRLLFHPKTNKLHFLAQLKAESDYDSFKKITNGIKSHPLGKQALTSTPLPRKLSDLRKNNIIPHSGNIEGEIAWTMESINENSHHLNSFIDLKNKFEQSILLCKYENAEKYLDTINDEICVSNWGVESKFILSEGKNGTEDNWLQLNDFSTKIKDGVSLFLAEQASKKSEEKLSYTRYKSNFESVTEGVNILINEYLCFRLLYPGYTGFQNYSFLINVESVSSIIDRYLMLIDVLTEITLTNGNELVAKVTSDLIQNIPNDCRVKQLYNFNSESFERIRVEAELLSYISHYTKGDYNYCLKNAEIIFNKYPNTIEPYLIFVKSLIELHIEFNSLDTSKIINSITQDLYNVYSRNDNYDASIENLLKTSLKYFSFKLGKQLFSIVSRTVKLNDKNSNHILLYSVNSEFTNPIILTDAILFNQNLKQKLYQKIEYYPSSSSLELNRLIAFGKYKEIEDNDKFSSIRKPVYIAKAINNAHDNQTLIKYIEKNINNDKLSIQSKCELIDLLYSAYFEENETSKALSLYIDKYFENKHIVANLNANILLEKIQKSDYKIETIDLPIFYSIVSPDIYEKYVKYDDFTEIIGINRPTEIIAIGNIQSEKLIYFLKEICTIDILHHSLNFEGTDDIENERISILKHLLVIDPNFESEYIEEITEISQRSKIRKAIREVNKGRITLNSQLLRSSIDNEIKDNFLRFKELVYFSEEHKLQSIDPTNKLLNNYFNSMQEKSQRDRFVNINDPAFIAFKSMMLDIRDKFILSKDFGLDGYLSTRIRHGTFINHIRSNFEAFNLINQKKEDIYSYNEYWKQRIPPELAYKQEDIQQCLKTFSKEIDDLTEFLIRELIQIKTEKHTLKAKALFDYSLDNKTLAFLFSEIKDSLNSHTAFLNFVFEYLEAKTEIQLKEIRELFKEGITEHYATIVKKLDSSVRSVIGDNSFVDLTSSIVKCQTNIQNEILNIAEWFSIANPSSDLTLDIETIVQTAIEITNTIYPNEFVEPKIDVDNEIPFASGTTNLIYIIRILLDNIIKHSGLPVSKRKILIRSDFINEKTLGLFIANDFQPELREKIESNLMETKKKWDIGKTDFAKSNIEGGSGFDKIRRILAVDMLMTNYKFDYTIKGNTVSIELDIEIQIL